MAILLNIIAFTACILWFHRIINNPGQKLILPVVLVYLGSVILSFFIALAIQNDYLDGAVHLLTCGASILIFWIWTTIVIIAKHSKNGQTKHIWIDLAQTSTLLIVPIFIVLVVTSLPFKIGG